MQINAYGYKRVSTGKQVKEGYSLEEQQISIEKYCKDSEINLLKVFADEGISGAKADEDEEMVTREGVQEMLGGLKKDNIAFIIVMNTSRLWRSDTAKFLIQRELRRHHVDIRAIENTNYSLYSEKNPSNFLIGGVTELLDEYDRLAVIYKLSKGRNRKIAGGGFGAGSPPLGYKTGQKRELEIKKEEAEAVRYILQLGYLNDGITLQSIADMANAQGYRTKRGYHFQPNSIKRILDKLYFYAGLVEVDGKLKIGKHEPIIRIGDESVMRNIMYKYNGSEDFD